MITTDAAGKRWADKCALCSNTRKNDQGDECHWCHAVRMRYGNYFYPINETNAHLFVNEPSTAWKPISSAPKDGTLVMLRYHGTPQYAYLGSWRNGTIGETPSNERAWRARCCGRYTSPTEWCEVPK